MAAPSDRLVRRQLSDMYVSDFINFKVVASVANITTMHHRVELIPAKIRQSGARTTVRKRLPGHRESNILQIDYPINSVD
jgi:hypothetical protein